MNQPKPYGNVLPLLSATGLNTCFPRARRQQRAGLDGGVPLGEVDHRGDQPAVAGFALRFGEVLLVFEPSSLKPVARRAEGQQIVVAVEVGVAHVQAREHPRAQELPVMHAAHPVDDDPEQVVGGVAVAPAHTGREFQRQLGRQPYQFILGVLPAEDRATDRRRRSRGCRKCGSRDGEG